jgi:hypothetical protein
MRARSDALGNEGKVFFFEKKKQKAFTRLSRLKRIKAFWSFFSKKDCLLIPLYQSSSFFCPFSPLLPRGEEE